MRLFRISVVRVGSYVIGSLSSLFGAALCRLMCLYSVLLFVVLLVLVVAVLVLVLFLLFVVLLSLLSFLLLLILLLWVKISSALSLPPEKGARIAPDGLRPGA